MGGSDPHCRVFSEPSALGGSKDSRQRFGGSVKMTEEPPLRGSLSQSEYVIAILIVPRKRLAGSSMRPRRQNDEWPVQQARYIVRNDRSDEQRCHGHLPAVGSLIRPARRKSRWSSRSFPPSRKLPQSSISKLDFGCSAD